MKNIRISVYVLVFVFIVTISGGCSSINCADNHTCASSAIIADNQSIADDDSKLREETTDYGYLTVDVPQIGKTNQQLYHIAWGSVITENVIDSVMVLSDGENNDQTFQKVYLAVASGDQFLVYSLGTWEYYTLQYGALTLFDFDDDGIDEIFVHLEVTGNGGTLTQVFKVQNDLIICWQDFDKLQVELNGTYLENHQLSLVCEDYPFECVIDLLPYGIPLSSYDKDGKMLGYENVFVSQIRSCTIAKTETGNVVCCKFLVSSHNVYLGDLAVTYLYDTNTCNFSPIEILFDTRL